MAYFVNKLTDKVTNATGSLIWRETLTKISNSLHQSVNVAAKYRNFLKTGNVVQLISKQSSSQNVFICFVHFILKYFRNNWIKKDNFRKSSLKLI